MTFGPYAEISEVKDEGDIVQTSFDFVTIKKMREMLQEGTVDVIGVVFKQSDVQEQKLKNGNTKPKKTVDIIDNSS